MYNYRFRRLFLALTLLVASYELLVTKCSAEETLTITTYYPSPYGSYNELRTYSNTYLATDSGSVGIGMTNPIATLTVGNNVSGLGLGGNTWVSLGLSGAKNAAGITMGSDTVLNRYLQMIWNDSSNYGIVTTSGSAQPLLLQTNGGDIGIGTAGPTGELHVSSANQANLILEDRDEAANQKKWQWVTAADVPGTLQLQNLNDNDTVKTKVMVFDTAGNVGIGTASPRAKLSITSGGIGVPGFSPTVHIANTNDPRLLLEDLDNGISEWAQDGALSLFGYENTFQIKRGINFTNGVIGSGIDTLTIDSSGNVGIGTADPKAGLHVADKGLYVGSLAWADTSTAWIIAGSSATASGPGLHRNYGIAGTGINAGVYGDVVVDPMFSFGGNKGALGYSYMPGGGASWVSTGVYGEKVGTDTNNYAGYFKGPVSINGELIVNNRIPTGEDILKSGPNSWTNDVVLRRDTLNAHIWPWGTGTTNNTVIIGTNRTTNLSVNGTKSFEINHPIKPNMKLVHACIEGPEVAVFYRGQGQLTNGKVIVDLPEYFEALTRKENRTVLVTPKFIDDEPISILAVSEVKDGKFSVKAIDAKNPVQSFYWEVKAIRADIPPLVVEKKKEESI